MVSEPLPLFAWDEERRTSRRKRNRLARRIGYVGLLCLGTSATIIAPPMPRLVWNASASAPIGLYHVVDKRPIVRGDMVIARMPMPARALAERRGYIPADVPLVKRVVAVTGDRVCAVGNVVTVGGKLRAFRRARDAHGRPLPWWRGCRTLRDGATFLMMADHADSFDGRYFGPSAGADIIGKATLLWAR